MRNSDSWEEVKNLVKERADIVEIVREHVDLKRSGFRFLGSCPFHQEKPRHLPYIRISSSTTVLAARPREMCFRS